MPPECMRPIRFNMAATLIDIENVDQCLKHKTLDISHYKQERLEKAKGNIPGTQAIYVRTFGCSHNISDSEVMMGLLSEYGYLITDAPEDADLWLINSCTVKNPSQDAMMTYVKNAKEQRKGLVVAGCVPQGDRNLKELEGVSVVGVTQIDRIVEVVEQTLAGNTVKLLAKKTLPSLDLPKIRKNKLVEIIPISTGCLGSCSYCKTKHARGHLGSYPVENIVNRVIDATKEGVKDVWLTSEDSGAYGRDIDSSLPALLSEIVKVLPNDCMLRVGMTNPPFILEHLEAMSKMLNHPNVYSFLHIPVQSGNNEVLENMVREYTIEDFCKVVDTIRKNVKDAYIATDIICGFPGETEEQFQDTMNLVRKYKFPSLYISQFYPRPGTAAAKMKRVPTQEVKQRSRQLTKLFESYTCFDKLKGQTVQVFLRDFEEAKEQNLMVGHTKAHVKVLLPRHEELIGGSVYAYITETSKWHVTGRIVEKPKNFNLAFASVFVVFIALFLFYILTFN